MKKVSLFFAAFVSLMIIRPASASPEDLNARIEARIQAAAKELPADQTDKVAAKCLAAQPKISAVRARSERSLGDNSFQYQRLKLYLDSLATLQGAGGLVPVRDNYSASKARLDALVGRYLQELSDLVDMDCRSNPAGFIVTLEAARNSRKEIIAAGQDLRDQGLGPVTEQVNRLARPIRSTNGE